MSHNTVSKYVKSLEIKHLIATEPTTVYTKDGQKRNGTLLYTILPIEQASKYYLDKQIVRADLIKAKKAYEQCERKKAG